MYYNLTIPTSVILNKDEFKQSYLAPTIEIIEIELEGIIASSTNNSLSSPGRFDNGGRSD